jgi:hypothetical protein
MSLETVISLPVASAGAPPGNPEDRKRGSTEYIVALSLNQKKISLSEHIANSRYCLVDEACCGVIEGGDRNGFDNMRKT